MSATKVDQQAAERVLDRAVVVAIADLRAGATHEGAYWRLLHAGLAAETLLGGGR